MGDIKTDDENQKRGFTIKIKKTNKWKVISAVLGAVIVVLALVYGFNFGKNSGISGMTVGDSLAKKIPLTVLNDARCKECDTTAVIGQLKSIFPNLEVKELDYSSNKGRELYDELGIKFLPVLLFDDSVKQGQGYSDVANFLEQTGNYLSLKIGSDFNPEAEICDNEIDDNGDGKIDCDDDNCKTDWKCMEKKEKPEIELFVMSHCPYGTQIEKGILPVAELLGDKIDFEVKFCDYAMHSKKELDEQTLQYCIQEEQKDKYIPYLRCFLSEGKTDDCLKEAKINQAKLDACIESTDKEFQITEKFNDKSQWISGRFPAFDVNKQENEKYGIRGSPGFVINGVVASVNRDSAALLNAVCLGFKDKPEECNEKLSSAAPSPGFGFSTSGNTGSAGSCE